jgi:hypothetical protein
MLRNRPILFLPTCNKSTHMEEVASNKLPSQETHRSDDRLRQEQKQGKTVAGMLGENVLV